MSTKRPNILLILVDDMGYGTSAGSYLHPLTDG